MPADVESLKRRRAALLSQRAPYESHWQLIADYCFPWRSSITTKRSPGAKLTEKLFSSQGVSAPMTLAASLGGTLTPSTQKWQSLTMRQEELREDQEVMAWLEEISERLDAAFNDRRANFHAEFGEAYQDLAVFGTAAVLMDERDPETLGQFAGFRFQALPLGSYTIAEDSLGRVDTLFRDFTLTARAAVQQWGEDVGDEILKCNREKPDDILTFCHAVYPRQDTYRERDDYRESKRGDTKHMPWASCYYALQPLRLIRESGYPEFPYLVPRWRKATGEVWGRGPADLALPDIRSLNREVELYLAAGAKATDPPLLVERGELDGEISLEPTAINYVFDTSRAIAPLESRTKWEAVEWLVTRLDASIREMFFVDQLRLIDKPNMTAYEVAVRVEAMQRLLGPTAGRMYSELLGPCVERGVSMMAQADALPPPPEMLMEAGGDIDIEYEGPLARAQRGHDLVAIERKNAWIVSVLPFAPQVVQKFDWDREAELVAQIAGYPADLIRADELVQQERAAQVQAQQGQAQMAAIAGAAQAAGQAAPMVKAVGELEGQRMGVAA